MTLENVHNVPQKKWGRWDDMQRRLFNHIYADAKQIGTSLFHPATIQKGLSSAEMDTVAWNAAWLAADHFYGDGGTTKIITIPDPEDDDETSLGDIQSQGDPGDEMPHTKPRGVEFPCPEKSTWKK